MPKLPSDTLSRRGLVGSLAAGVALPSVAFAQTGLQQPGLQQPGSQQSPGAIQPGQGGGTTPRA